MPLNIFFAKGPMVRVMTKITRTILARSISHEAFTCYRVYASLFLVILLLDNLGERENRIDNFYNPLRKSARRKSRWRDRSFSHNSQQKLLLTRHQLKINTILSNFNIITFNYHRFLTVVTPLAIHIDIYFEKKWFF